MGLAWKWGTVLPLAFHVLDSAIEAPHSIARKLGKYSLAMYSEKMRRIWILVSLLKLILEK